MYSECIEEFDTDEEDETSIPLPIDQISSGHSIVENARDNNLLLGQGIFPHSLLIPPHPSHIINTNIDSSIPCSFSSQHNPQYYSYEHHYPLFQLPIQQNEVFQPRKLKRNKKIQLVKLTDYSKNIRDFAWNDFLAKKSLIDFNNLLKIQKTDPVHLKRLNDLKEERNLLLEQLKNRPSDLPEPQTLSLIAQKIKSQKQKRRRNQEFSPSELEWRAKELAQKNKEIEEWQLNEQKKLIETRESDKFKSEVKQTLREIRRKKRIVKEHKELLETLSKLRNVRQKQNLNSKLNYKVNPKEDRVFVAGVANLSASLDVVSKEVESEENMLNLMLCEYKSKNELNKTGETNEDESARRLRKYEERKRKLAKISSDNYVFLLFEEWKNYAINPGAFNPYYPRLHFFQSISKKLGL